MASARGRPLKAKLPPSVRPTTDYAREAIFSMLESRGGLHDLVVADLYCGSGAMGIEALSRGAAKVYFVDADPACLAATKTNLEPLRLGAEAVFVRAGLPLWDPPHDLDLVLADPPYGPLDLASVLRGVVASRVIVENDRHHGRARGLDRVTKTKRYGTTLVTMLEPDKGATRDGWSHSGLVRPFPQRAPRDRRAGLARSSTRSWSPRSATPRSPRRSSTLRSAAT